MQGRAKNEGKKEEKNYEKRKYQIEIGNVCEGRKTCLLPTWRSVFEYLFKLALK